MSMPLCAAEDLLDIVGQIGDCFHVLVCVGTPGPGVITNAPAPPQHLAAFQCDFPVPL